MFNNKLNKFCKSKIQLNNKKIKEIESENNQEIKIKLFKKKYK